MRSILKDLEVVDSFNTCLSVPEVNLEEELSAILSNFNVSS
jgi:hypothetical protein